MRKGKGGRQSSMNGEGGHRPNREMEGERGLLRTDGLILQAEVLVVFGR